MNGVKVRVYYPKNSTNSKSKPVKIYIHGGGFFLGVCHIINSSMIDLIYLLKFTKIFLKHCVSNKKYMNRTQVS